jgi:hypothetical protein
MVARRRRPSIQLWKDRVFAIRAKAHWLERCSTDLCADINWWRHLLCPFFFISLFWRLSNKLMHLGAGFVMEGSMMFCQKNILGHSRLFHGDYKRRCLLTIMVSQILQLTQLISEIKNTFTATNELFPTQSLLNTAWQSGLARPYKKQIYKLSDCTTE